MSFTIYNRTHVCILTIFANISFSETLKSLKWIFKKSMGKTHKNQISAADNSKIDPRGFLCIYDIFSRPFSKYLMHIEKFQIFHFFHFWQITHQSLKKVCDKVSKVKIPKQLFVSFFHASCHGRLVFYPNQIYVGPIWLLKWSILAISEKLKSLKLIFQNPWVKNPKAQILLHTICRLVQDNHFAPRTFFLCSSESGLIFWSHLIRKWSLIFFKKAIRSKRSLKIPPTKKSFQQSWRHPSWRAWTEGRFAYNPFFIWSPKIHAT